MNNLPDIITYFTPDIVTRFAEVIQPRSDYQIANFVINQHETPEMQYVQCINELQSLYYTIRSVDLEMKKTNIEIERLRATGDEIDELEAQKKELGQQQTQIVAVGAFRELKKLIEILDTFPRYTREEIEQAEETYWQQRLHRQATLQAISGHPAQAAHLDSLRQIGMLKITPEGIESVKNKELEL